MRICYLLLLLYISPCFGQQYDFDYIQEIRLEPLGEPGSTVFRFFNSKDDSYALRVSIIGERVLMTLHLDNGKYYTDTILKKDFFVLAISLKCPKSGISKSLADKDPDDFICHKLSDTVINNIPYSHIKLMPVNQKKYDKGKIAAAEYILDNSLNLGITVTEPYSMLSLYKQKGMDVPNGIIKEYYTHDKQGKLQDHIYTIQCVPVQKIIFLDTSCK